MPELLLIMMGRLTNYVVIQPIVIEMPTALTYFKMVVLNVIGKMELLFLVTLGE